MKRDVLCMGRAAVDLYADQWGASLEQASSFSRYVGGCPANIAIGASRLGLKTGMLTRLGNESMGHFVAQTLEKEGVDTSNIQWDNHRLTGLVLLGVNPPNNFPLIFYRENCADMAIDEYLLSEQMFSQYRALLVTGTHCSTIDSYKTTMQAIKLAKAAGCKIILDIDYRPVLWKVAVVGEGESRNIPTHLLKERFSFFLEECDLIVGTEEEILIASDQTDLAAALHYLQEMTSGVIVQKRGDQGCLVHTFKRAHPIVGKAFPVEVLNLLGAGDGFMSGFLSGWLREMSLEECCTLANACGALVVSRHGCSPAIPYWSELTTFIGNGSSSVVDRMHNAIDKQREDLEELDYAILAFDHRKHFHMLSEDSKKIEAFKCLIFESVSSLELPKNFRKGIIVDQEFGSSVLKQSSLWTARPIEQSASIPLQLLNDLEAHHILRHWPQQHVVKVLCFMPHNLINRELQRKQLLNVYNACSSWGHELLIELLPENESENLPETWYQENIAFLYEGGIYPNWWKLPLFSSKREAWERLHNTIDPFCKGVFLLGRGSNLVDLKRNLKECEGLGFTRGFAVGRTIWEAAATAWFNHKIDEEDVIEWVQSNYLSIIEVWQTHNDREIQWS